MMSFKLIFKTGKFKMSDQVIRHFRYQSIISTNL